MISIIGLGFVGSAIEKSFNIKKIKQYSYDKYKDIGNIEKCLDSEIAFLCLPTLYSEDIKEYDKTALHNVIKYLAIHKYNGTIVIKSTIEPNTTNQLYNRYSEIHDINLVHNPEFLTTITAFEDFHNQKHIVLGKHKHCNQKNYQKLIKLYKDNYPDAKISECTSNESESMKLFVNNFYASKIQLFNEYYLLCKKIGIDYDNVKDLMLKNNWINPMHTKVPGTDGKLSYGGFCFPKDTNALNEYMKRNNSTNKVLNSVIESRNELRNDNTNIENNNINHLIKSMLIL